MIEFHAQNQSCQNLELARLNFKYQFMSFQIDGICNFRIDFRQNQFTALFKMLKNLIKCKIDTLKFSKKNYVLFKNQNPRINL